MRRRPPKQSKFDCNERHTRKPFRCSARHPQQQFFGGMILQEVTTEYEPGCLVEKSTRSGSAIQTLNAYIMDLPMNGMFALNLGTTHLILTTSMTTLMAMILSSSNQLWLPHLPKSSPLLRPLKNGWRNKPTMDEPSSKTVALGRSSRLSPQYLQHHLLPRSQSINGMIPYLLIMITP